MKKIILSALLASVSLIAADSAPVEKSGAFLPIDGAAHYKQHCAICHGEKGENTPRGGAVPLAGTDAVKLALDIRAYRNQGDSENVGAYTMNKDSRVMYDATSGLSNKEIVALAKYISSLK